ncbi:hypothetical protein RUM43_007205 [Polyplax serrata]|uniref:Uncharacterized protein n=1 Tax=Polyplax serrata TaxID=468196 RepID=A0AAN8P5B0_POLSC
MPQETPKVVDLMKNLSNRKERKPRTRSKKSSTYVSNTKTHVREEVEEASNTSDGGNNFNINFPLNWFLSHLSCNVHKKEEREDESEGEDDDDDDYGETGDETLRDADTTKEKKRNSRSK